jgi:phosphohistidine phosphatase
MKTLTLLRHAKSTWDDPVARDFDRPLNRRGRLAARTVGSELRAQGSCSTMSSLAAVRVRETLEEVACGLWAAASAGVRAARLSRFARDLARYRPWSG